MTLKPTEAEVRAEPAGRRIDAWVHWLVCGHKRIACIHSNVTKVHEGSSLFKCDSCGKEFGSTTYAMARSSWPPYSTDWSAAGPLLESCPWPCDVQKTSYDNDGDEADSLSGTWSWEVWIYTAGLPSPEQREDETLSDYTRRIAEATISVDADPAKPNDLCRAICIARILAVLAEKETKP